MNEGMHILVLFGLILFMYVFTDIQQKHLLILK